MVRAFTGEARNIPHYDKSFATRDREVEGGTRPELLVDAQPLLQLSLRSFIASYDTRTRRRMAAQLVGRRISLLLLPGKGTRTQIER